MARLALSAFSIACIASAKALHGAGAHVGCQAMLLLTLVAFGSAFLLPAPAKKEKAA